MTGGPVTGLGTGVAEAVTLVEEGFVQYSALALRAFNEALDFVDSLVKIDIPQASFNIPFDVPVDLGAPFTKPDAPTAPNLIPATIAAPASVSIGSAPIIATPAFPAFDSAPPQFNSPTAPAPFQGDPGPAPALTAPDVPDAPTFIQPTAPDLFPIALPSLPDLDIPQFTSLVPALPPDLPITSFTYTDPGYIDQFGLDSVMGNLFTSKMLLGKTGLPDDVEQALFDRARSRSDASSNIEVQNAMEEWSSRGFTLPGGEISRKVDAARQKAQDARNAANRDINIQVYNILIDQLKLAIQNGIALSGLLINLYNTVQDRALRSLIAISQAAVATYNAKVAMYTAGLQAYAIQAQVYKDQIEAESLKVEIYRNEVEAQKAIAQINEVDAEIYKTKVEAIQAFAEVYRIQIAAVQARVDVERLQVEAYRSTVEAFAQQVLAKRAEFEGYKYEVEAEATKVTAYEAETRAFGELVRAANVKLETQLAAPRFNLEYNRLAIQKYQADTQQYVGRVDAEAKRISEAVQIFDGQSRLYAAELGAEQSRVLADSRQFELAVEKAKSATSLALEQVKTAISQVQESAKTIVEALKGAATTSAQLAAGAMSAVNLSARVGQEDNTSLSENVNHQLTGVSPISA